MFFASDNTSGAAPEIMAAVARANEGYAPSYEAEPTMDRVQTLLREVFEAPDAAVHLVATGTAANSLALACLTPPWGAIFAHAEAHVEQDECGGPEFYTGGAKVVPVPGPHGKMVPETLAPAIASPVFSSVHGVQRASVSITNVTEAGTVYTPAEVAALTAVARDAGLAAQMDGSRFANALVATGASPAEMTWKSGVDAVSFGGTKNGCLGVEAVVIFDPAKSWEFELRRKRAGHLFSKHRFLSAQMEAYLEGGLWLTLARSANARAARLAEGLRAIPGVTLIHPPQANMIFFSASPATHRRAHQAGARYPLGFFDLSPDTPDDRPQPARLVCSWCTTDADVDRLLAVIRG